MPVDRTCQWCGKEFKTKAATVKRGHGKFCSRSCKGSFTCSQRNMETDPDRTSSDELTYRKCSGCLVEKILDEAFNRDKGGRRGHRAQCKLCESTTGKDFRLRNGDEIRAKDRKRRPGKGRKPKLTKEEKQQRAILGRAAIMRKWCPRCETSLLTDNFTFDYRKLDGCKSWCKDCQKSYYAKRRHLYLPKKRESGRTTSRALRMEILQHYSGIFPCCACCEENRIEFLSVDHINGGGSKHKREVKDLYRWMKKNNFPEGFRILCHNCNQSRGAYGYCPHEKEREQLTKVA